MTIVMIGQKGIPARSGGIERHVESLALGVAESGHRVVVFGRSWYVADRPTVPGIVSRPVRGIRSKHLDAITHGVLAVFAAREEHPNIVHLHGAGNALLAPLVRVVHPQAKLVVTFHCLDHVLSKWGNVARFSFRLGEWLGCRFAHATVAVSESLVSYCQQTYGAQTLFYTHPVINRSTVADPAWLEKHGLRDGGYFLSVGRLVADKQVHTLIEAYAEARRTEPDVFADRKLVIVGGTRSSDPYVADMCRKAAQTSGVLLLGEKVGAELSSLQAFAFAHVFPSSNEGLSLAVVEACFTGRPIVAGDIPGNREATGGHFLPFQPGDVSSLARALVHLAALGTRERKALGSKAQKQALKAYDFHTRTEEMVRLYESLLAPKAGAERLAKNRLFGYLGTQP